MSTGEMVQDAVTVEVTGGMSGMEAKEQIANIAAGNAAIATQKGGGEPYLNLEICKDDDKPSIHLTIEEARQLTANARAHGAEYWIELVTLFKARAHQLLDYTNWGDYAVAELDCSRSRGYQLLQAGRLCEEFSQSTNVDRVPNEAQCRALLKIPNVADRAAVWQWVNDPAHHLPITAAVITRTMNEFGLRQGTKAPIVKVLPEKVSEPELEERIDRAFEAYPQLSWLKRDEILGAVETLDAASPEIAKVVLTEANSGTLIAASVQEAVALHQAEGCDPDAASRAPTTGSSGLRTAPPRRLAPPQIDDLNYSRPIFELLAGDFLDTLVADVLAAFPTMSSEHREKLSSQLTPVLRNAVLHLCHEKIDPLLDRLVEDESAELKAENRRLTAASKVEGARK